MRRSTIILAALLIATAAVAHGTTKGANGGPQVHTGDMHIEMVASDAALAVYLRDDSDKPIAADGSKAVGIFVVEGKPLRIELQPGGANKLTGVSTVPLPADLKGAVRITLPSGKTVRAKFE